MTRPGVFSHRELDNGARQLLDSVDVFPSADILDIGCGSGAVAMVWQLASRPLESTLSIAMPEPYGVLDKLSSSMA